VRRRPGVGQHRAGGVVHAGQQVDRAAVGACPAGAAQGLAVDRDGPPPTTSGGARRPSVRRMVAAAGTLKWPGAWWRAPSAARTGPGRVGGPPGDRDDRPRPCQHRGGGQAQDGDQPVAAATGSSRVRDGNQVGQQVRGFAVVEGLGVGKLGQGGWDRR
jgi:hypothetical protein